MERVSIGNGTLSVCIFKRFKILQSITKPTKKAAGAAFDYCYFISIVFCVFTTSIVGKRFGHFALSSAIVRAISTPITDAIIRPRVQPLLSPRQCRPSMDVLSFSSILILLL